MGFVSPFLNKSESLPVRGQSVLFLLRSDLPQNCPLSVESVQESWGTNAKDFQIRSLHQSYRRVISPGSEYPWLPPPFPFTRGQAAERPRARATEHGRLSHLDCDPQYESRLSHICVQMCVSCQFHKRILTLRTWDALCFLFFHLKSAACSPRA